MVYRENAAIVGQILGGRIAFGECLDGNRHRAVPEGVKTLRDLVDDRALAGVKVVLSCAGPFAHTATPSTAARPSARTIARRDR